MYGEDVTILVDGKKITLFVYCLPNMSEYKLKKLAIDKYIKELKIELYKENNLKED
jgi:hypothetical protein